MRRASLVAVLIGGGALFSLPFRRVSVPQPAAVDEERQTLLDDRQIEMLVRDITQDVRPPTVYDPKTDYLPPPSQRSERTMPLSYQDLAVPVDEDPFYAQRFNATESVAQRNLQSRTAKQVADLNRRFNLPAAESTNSLRHDQQIVATPPVRPQADTIPENALPQNASTRLSAGPSGGTQSPFSQGGTDQSILSPLPPPEDNSTAGDADSQSRKKYWIRQPD